MHHPTPAETPQEEARRARILDGAAAAFLNYGFQRTTMEDIARAAEISRPALYLIFRNKTDIYRALAAEFLQKFLSGAEAALAGDGPLADRMERAVRGIFDMVAEIERSPHGAEILDMKGSLAADIMADGRARMQALFEAAIARESALLGRLDAEPSPALLAAFIHDALDGLTLRKLPVEEQCAVAGRYIRLALGALGNLCRRCRRGEIAEDLPRQPSA